MTQLTDSNFRHTIFSYDAAGRKTLETDAAGQTRSTAYDTVNNVTQSRWTSGRWVDQRL